MLPAPRIFSVAPMIDCTDRHFRFLARLITTHALLYTEMITTGALLHGDPARHLDYNTEEHPLALQLGGSDPHDLARCAKLGEHWGYDEINLNCGCPSDRVQSGRFGACLMADPSLVADGLKAMSDAVDIPVTIKCRIGLADKNTATAECYDEFRDFIGAVTRDSGCATVLVHARKAWLHGLSPKENREIPPLRYDYVYKLKQDFPALEIILNGGVTTLEQVQQHLQHVDGVMMGREAYQNPYILAEVDRLFYGDVGDAPSRHEIAGKFRDYCEHEMARGTRLHHLTRHVLGLYHNQTGAKKFRRYLSEHATAQDADITVLEQALELVA